MGDYNGRNRDDSDASGFDDNASVVGWGLLVVPLSDMWASVWEQVCFVEVRLNSRTRKCLDLKPPELG